jgi:phosphodiesterase/alkaline phosphatase D-like protein
MKARRLLAATLAIVAPVGIVTSNPSTAQLLPPAKHAEHVKIRHGPTLESAVDNMAILRWTSTNPGGDDEHYAVAHYGTDPHDLSETARSHIRLNRNHPETIFRVRLIGLKPQTTYYYRVTSMGGDGINDGVKSGIHQFTTAAPGKRIILDPQPR